MKNLLVLVVLAYLVYRAITDSKRLAALEQKAGVSYSASEVDKLIDNFKKEISDSTENLAVYYQSSKNAIQ